MSKEELNQEWDELNAKEGVLRAKIEKLESRADELTTKKSKIAKELYDLELQGAGLWFQVGDKVRVKDSKGSTLTKVESINFSGINNIKMARLKGSRIDMKVMYDSIRKASSVWRGAYWEYQSFN